MTAAPTAPSSSGIAAVDRTWGGLRPGASVLLVGRAAAGRTALALQAVRAAVAAGQTALLLSPRTPADLNASAQSAGFDLAALHASGRLRVLRIPSAKDLASKGNDGLQAAYRDLAGLAGQAGAHRVVIEDLTPLVQFTTFEAFGTAFDGLRESLGDAALVVGLGEPANAPSRQLVGVVQERVDGLVRVKGDDVQFEATATPEPTMKSRVQESPVPPMAPPDFDSSPPERPAPAVPEEAPAVSPEPAVEAAPAFEPPPAAEPAPAVEPPAVFEPPPAFAPPPTAAEPTPAFETPAAFDAPDTPISFDAPSGFAPDPAPDAPDFDADAFSNDGASVPIDSPEPTGHDLDFAPEMPTPPAGVAGGAGSGEPSGFLRAGVEPAPPPDPELAAPGSDPFGRDPGKAFFENGYLVDSRGATATPITAAHPEPVEYAPPPAPMPPPGVVPMGAPSVPSFAPLSAPAGEDPGPAQNALQASFNARAQGTPFLVIAARMEPTQPESVQFSAVVEGLRAAVPTGGAFYADVARFRSLLVLPGATSDAAAGVFAALQQHLQSTIGAQAEGTLRAVAAITVPDGQPFTTAQELWEYAVAS